jgi:hypothetical protein
LRDGSELRRAELLREYEMLRGSKRELAAELARLQSTDLDQRLAFEERMREIEAGLSREEKAANDHRINIVTRNLLDNERVNEGLEVKINEQSVDIERKRLKMYDTLRDLEEKVRITEEEVSEKRLALARKQEDNKRIGHSLRLKTDQTDKLEAEITDMKRTFEKLADLERERKEDAHHRHIRNKAIA